MEQKGKKVTHVLQSNSPVENGELIMARGKKSTTNKVQVQVKVTPLSQTLSLEKARHTVKDYNARRAAALKALGDTADADRISKALVSTAGIIDAADQRCLVIAAQQSVDIRLKEDARTLLVNCNTLAVKKIASRYEGQGVPFDDLVQEGTIGLLKAIERYDITAAASFLTYANWWIRQGITRAVQERGSMIGTPSYLHALKIKVEVARRRLQSRGSDEPTLEQIAREVNNTMDKGKEYTIEKIAQALAISNRRISSFDAQVQTDDDSVDLSNIVLAQADKTAEDLSLAERDNALESALSKLSAQHRNLIIRKYGLRGAQETTNIDLEKEFGMSKGQLDNQLKKAYAALIEALSNYGHDVETMLPAEDSE